MKPRPSKLRTLFLYLQDQSCHFCLFTSSVSNTCPEKQIALFDASTASSMTGCRWDGASSRFHDAFDTTVKPDLYPPGIKLGARPWAEHIQLCCFAWFRRRPDALYAIWLTPPASSACPPLVLSATARVVAFLVSCTSALSAPVAAGESAVLDE